METRQLVAYLLIAALMASAVFVAWRLRERRRERRRRRRNFYYK